MAEKNLITLKDIRNNPVLNEAMIMPGDTYTIGEDGGWDITRVWSDPNQKLDLGLEVTEQDFTTIWHALSAMQDTDFLNIMVKSNPKYKKVIKYLGGNPAEIYLRYLDQIDRYKSESKIRREEVSTSKTEQDKRRINMQNILGINKKDED